MVGDRREFPSIWGRIVSEDEMYRRRVEDVFASVPLPGLRDHGGSGFPGYVRVAGEAPFAGEDRDR
jgi:hypothetical protein